MKKILTILYLLTVVSVSAQEMNDYKYILIPETYEFTGEKDQYRLNSLTKFLFEKEGFSTYMQKGEKPADLQNNPCLGLVPRVENNSGLFVTKLVIILEDCYGNAVFRSTEGRSREKEYNEAYQEALRTAFESIKEIDYHYNPMVSAESEKKEVKLSETTVKTEIEEEEEIFEERIEEADDDEAIEDQAENLEAEDDDDSGKFYRYSGKIFQLKPSAAGLGLYQKDSPEPIAILIESNDGKTYIYNSLTNQGIAYFDTDDNLVVEYFSRQDNKKITLKYELTD